MMTGQPPGAKRVAILSARTPAQSRNSTLARSKTSRPVKSSTARAACSKNLPVAGKIQVTAQDEGADRSIADGLDRQGTHIHGFSIGSRGLDDTKMRSAVASKIDPRSGSAKTKLSVTAVTGPGPRP